MPTDPADVLAQLVPTCPAPPVSPPMGYDIRVAPGPDAASIDWIDLEVRPGILDQAGGGLCARVRAQNLRTGEASGWVEIVSEAPCVAVPEPGISTGLLVAVFVMGGLPILASRLGARMRRLGESYPVADVPRGTPQTKNAPRD